MTRATLALMCAVVLLAAARVGVVVGRNIRRSTPGSRLAGWVQMDFVREAALWGFKYGSPDAAERLVLSQVDSLAHCEKQAPTYPCKGKLPIEAFLMMAALKDEQGDGLARDVWLAKVLKACGGSAAATCTPSSVHAAMDRFTTLRAEGTSRH